MSDEQAWLAWAFAWHILVVALPVVGCLLWYRHKTKGAK